MFRLSIRFPVCVLIALLSVRTCYSNPGSWITYGGDVQGLQFKYTTEPRGNGVTYYQYAFKNTSNQVLAFNFEFFYVDTTGTKRKESGVRRLPPGVTTRQISQGQFFNGVPGQTLNPTVWIADASSSSPPSSSTPGETGAAFQFSDWNSNVTPQVTLENMESDTENLQIKFAHSGLRKSRCKAVFTVRHRESGRVDTMTTNFTPAFLSGSYRNPPLMQKINYRNIKLQGGVNNFDWTVRIYAFLDNGKGTLVAQSTQQTFEVVALIAAVQATPAKNYGTYRTSARAILVQCKDHGSIDGDMVGIYANGVSYGTVKLTAFVSNVDIPLRLGENRITFVALNEGSSSPNTAAFRVFEKNGYAISEEKEWSLKTGEEGEIVVIRQ